MSDRDDDREPTPDEIEQVSTALREIAPRTGEPDWAKLSADIGAAVDDESRRQRRARVVWIGGAVLAAAAVAALLVWPVARERSRATHEAVGAVDAAPARDVLSEEIEIDDELADELALPDDLGGITLDEELIDEAAAALDEDLGEEADALDDRLLPDGAWIDELSDDDLERAVVILDQEAS